MAKNSNRKDNIRKASLEFEEESLRICVDRYSFVRGAEWADSNPKCPWTLVEDFYPSIIRGKSVSEKVLILFMKDNSTRFFINGILGAFTPPIPYKIQLSPVLNT